MRKPISSKNHNKNALALACAFTCAALASSFTHAETEYKIGGYVKFDAIFSQYSDAQRAASVGDDFLVPSTIAVGDGSGEGDMVFDSNAKFSRINFKTTTGTDVGDVVSFIEMDFNAGNDERLTNQASNGLRHAFLAWNKPDGSSITAGQTWSTFFNVGALPEAVDFIGPTSGSIFVRQPQVRYTMPMAGGKLMVAAENPSSGLHDNAAVTAGSYADDNQIDDNTMPDIIGRYDGGAGSLSYSAAVMLRQIAYNDGTNSESENATAVSLSGKYVLGNGDDIKVMISSGTLGRYIALNAYRDGGVKADGSIDLTTVTGGYVAYKHMWSPMVRSTFSYAFSEADNSSAITSDVTKSVNNVYANLMYSPTKQLTFGGEYMIAERETESGANGDLTRIQFTSKLSF
ncbi:MAG: porin [Gammaproteobacteria bacterium]|nr:porin [Gammaproteobacteria bacterium]